jgi:hypothetical protein
VLSANTGRQSSRGIVIIDNVKQYRQPGTKVLLADYRVRAFPRGTKLEKIIQGAKAHRHGMVKGHRKEDEPVWNLVAKALKELRYG